MHLPEGHELVVGTRKGNIYLYYKLVSVALIGNLHGIKIIINVPLKTTDLQFTLRLSGYNFVRF